MAVRAKRRSRSIRSHVGSRYIIEKLEKAKSIFEILNYKQVLGD